MKKLLMGSGVLTVFALAITLFQMSCSKDTNAQPTTLTKDQILVQKEWKIDQLHRVSGGHYGSFSAGGSNSTGINFEKIRYTFNSDGTGTYTTEQGTNYTTKWEFTTADKRTLKFTVSNFPSYTWQMVEISGSYLHATENFPTPGSTDNLHSYRLIQIP
jgi:hypothetical protein